MNHRRLFLKQLASVAGATGLGSLLTIDEAFASGLQRLATAHPNGTGPSQIRNQYLLSPNITYLNHGSIGTIPRLVHSAHKAYLEICETNPWLYIWGDAWEEPREAVRQKAATLLGANADEVALTHNTTEGFNILAQGLPLGRGDQVVFSSLNHPGASVCWVYQAKARGFDVHRFSFPALETPHFTREDILNLYDRHITPRTRVLVFPHIDNILGVRHPVRELTDLARSKGVEFVAVDGAQSVGMVPVDVATSGVDFYAASPHKWLQAPKGLGVLYVRKDVQHALRPMWVTWGQERWAGTVRIFEDYGTRNLPELLAMGDAIDFQNQLGEQTKETQYRQSWEWWRAATDSADRATWRSPTSWSLASSLFALEIEGIESRDLFNRLNLYHGFVFRAFRTQGLNTARISPNLINTDEDIDRFFAAVDSLR